MSKIERNIIVYGNDAELYVDLQKFDKDSEQFIDFDLNQATDIRVFLICSKHATQIELQYTIDVEHSNVLVCPISYKLLHPNASYGIVVEGYDIEQHHWRFELLPSEGFLVISNTSGVKITDSITTIMVTGKCGWGISDANMDDYYTKQEIDIQLGTKQNNLISGTNIKTINNQSILGSGNITVATEQVQSDWNEDDPTAVDYIKNKPTIPTPILFTYNEEAGLTPEDIELQIAQGGDLYLITNDSYYPYAEYINGTIKWFINSIDTIYPYTENVLEYRFNVNNDEWQVTETDLATTGQLRGKQDTLVSGTNIKTINNESILGSGNIEIDGEDAVFPMTYDGTTREYDFTWSEITEAYHNGKAVIVRCHDTSSQPVVDKDYTIAKIDSMIIYLVHYYEKKYEAITLMGSLNDEIVEDSYVKGDLQGKLTFDDYPDPDSENPVTSVGISLALDEKQDALVSGTNIKTINNQSILGSGNITVATEQVQSDWYSNDASSYSYILHKPTINTVGTTTYIFGGNTQIEIGPTSVKLPVNSYLNLDDKIATESQLGSKQDNAILLEVNSTNIPVDLFDKIQQGCDVYCYTNVGNIFINYYTLSHVMYSMITSTHFTYVLDFTYIDPDNNLSGKGYRLNYSLFGGGIVGVAWTNIDLSIPTVTGIQTIIDEKVEYIEEDLDTLAVSSILSVQGIENQIDTSIDSLRNELNNTNSEKTAEIKQTIGNSDLVSSLAFYDLNSRVSELEESSCGTTGIQGVTGIQGLQGETGIQGEQGITGMQGIQGEQGVTGIQGLQGETGPMPTNYVESFNGQTGIVTYTSPVLSVNGMTGAVTIQTGGSDTFTPTDYEQQYLTFVALEDTTFTFSNNDLQYSIDNGATWETLTAGTSTPTIETSNTILWKGSNLTVGNSGPGTFSSTGKFNVYGNIMSLYFDDEFYGKDDVTVDYAFYGLFSGNTKVINAKNLYLTATKLTAYIYAIMFENCTYLQTAPTFLEYTQTRQYKGCYFWAMFRGCTSLVEAPKKLKIYFNSTSDERGNTFSNMFKNCTYLTTAPEIDVNRVYNNMFASMFEACVNLVNAPSKLPDNVNNLNSTWTAFQFMFKGCISLVKAPVLPRLTLNDNCYWGMFQNCTSLNYIKCLATTISDNRAVNIWVDGVAATGTFIIADGMTGWTTGTSGIPTGWDVYTESEYEDAKNYQIKGVVKSSTEGLNIELVNTMPTTGIQANTIYLVV